MGSAVRLIVLMNVARVRAAGPVPWLLVIAWMALAWLQEPRALRRSGIHLFDDATWIAGVVLVLILLLSEARAPRRFAAVCNLALLVGIAFVLSAAAAALDRGYLSVSLGGRAWQWLAFVLCWSPLVLLLSRTGAGSLFARSFHTIGVPAAAGIGSMLCVRLRSGVDVPAICAAVLALVGSSCIATDGKRK